MRRYAMRSRLILAVAVVLVPTTHTLAEIQYDDFSDTTGLTLNGAATTLNNGSDGVVLRLTPALQWHGGSAFSKVQVDAESFSTYFQFRITDPGGPLFEGNTEPGADGIVFVIQPVASSHGGAGEGIGYKDISPSVGVEFDTWLNSSVDPNDDPNSNHLGIDLNGVVDHGPGSPYTVEVTPDFDDGNKWHAWIDYDGTTLEVRANQDGIRPALALLDRELDIPAILGQGTGYVGFTSGTGMDYGNHDLIRWRHTAYIPEPAMPGDTNDDDIVNGLDYDNLVAQFGGPPGAESADFDGDGRVDLEDFAIQRGNFGFGVSAAEFGATIPEPATLSLLTLGGLAILRRRSR